MYNLPTFPINFSIRSNYNCLLILDMFFLDAPYRSEINKAVLKLQESGELNRLKKKWWEELNPKNPCPVSLNYIQCNKIVAKSLL